MKTLWWVSNWKMGDDFESEIQKGYLVGFLHGWGSCKDSVEQYFRGTSIKGMEIWIMVAWKQRLVKHQRNYRMFIIRKKQAFNKCYIASFEYSRDKLEHE